MTALYLHEDVKKLLSGKTIVMIGDSVDRSCYKDLVVMLQENRYLTDQELRAKGEDCFSGDELLFGGRRANLGNSVHYREERRYKAKNGATMWYFFVTICYSEYIEKVLARLANMQTDIICMKSCLWDVHRYGNKGVENYENNLLKLIKCLRKMLPDCLFIWLTTPPVALKSKGGFLEQPGEDLVKIHDVKRCNNIARAVFTEANRLERRFRVVDLDYVFQYFERHRASDGVHWNEKAHRRMSNMILEEVSKAFNMPVPRILQEENQNFLRNPQIEQLHDEDSFDGMWNESPGGGGNNGFSFWESRHGPGHQLSNSFQDRPPPPDTWDIRSRAPEWNRSQWGEQLRRFGWNFDNGRRGFHTGMSPSALFDRSANSSSPFFPRSPFGMREAMSPGLSPFNRSSFSSPSPFGGSSSFMPNMNRSAPLPMDEEMSERIRKRIEMMESEPEYELPPGFSDELDDMAQASKSDNVDHVSRKRKLSNSSDNDSYREKRFRVSSEGSDRRSYSGSRSRSVSPAYSRSPSPVSSRSPSPPMLALLRRKRMLEDRASSSVRKLSIVEIGGKVMKLVEIEDGVVIHARLNAKELSYLETGRIQVGDVLPYGELPASPLGLPLFSPPLDEVQLKLQEISKAIELRDALESADVEVPEDEAPPSNGLSSVHVDIASLPIVSSMPANIHLLDETPSSSESDRLPQLPFNKGFNGNPAARLFAKISSTASKLMTLLSRTKRTNSQTYSLEEKPSYPDADVAFGDPNSPGNAPGGTPISTATKSSSECSLPPCTLARGIGPPQSVLRLGILAAKTLSSELARDVAAVESHLVYEHKGGSDAPPPVSPPLQAFSRSALADNLSFEVPIADLGNSPSASNIVASKLAESATSVRSSSDANIRIASRALQDEVQNSLPVSSPFNAVPPKPLLSTPIPPWSGSGMPWPYPTPSPAPMYDQPHGGGFYRGMNPSSPVRSPMASQVPMPPQQWPAFRPSMPAGFRHPPPLPWNHPMRVVMNSASGVPGQTTLQKADAMRLLSMPSPFAKPKTSSAQNVNPVIPQLPDYHSKVDSSLYDSRVDSIPSNYAIGGPSKGSAEIFDSKQTIVYTGATEAFSPRVDSPLSDRHSGKWVLDHGKESAGDNFSVENQVRPLGQDTDKNYTTPTPLQSSDEIPRQTPKYSQVAESCDASKTALDPERAHDVASSVGFVVTTVPISPAVISSATCSKDPSSGLLKYSGSESLDSDLLVTTTQVSMPPSTVPTLPKIPSVVAETAIVISKTTSSSVSPAAVSTCLSAGISHALVSTPSSDVGQIMTCSMPSLVLSSPLSIPNCESGSRNMIASASATAVVEPAKLKKDRSEKKEKREKPRKEKRKHKRDMTATELEEHKRKKKEKKDKERRGKDENVKRNNAVEPNGAPASEKLQKIGIIGEHKEEYATWNKPWPRSNSSRARSSTWAPSYIAGYDKYNSHVEYRQETQNALYEPAYEQQQAMHREQALLQQQQQQRLLQQQQLLQQQHAIAAAAKQQQEAQAALVQALQQQQQNALRQQQLTSQQQQQALSQQSLFFGSATSQPQLYIDEFGQTYTLEEQTYIVGPSGEISSLASSQAYGLAQQQPQGTQQQFYSTSLGYPQQTQVRYT